VERTAKEIPSTFNARAETIAQKPVFRSAFKRTRCIVPASGYYKWRAAERGEQLYFISPADGAVLSIAGHWDEWRDPGTGKAVLGRTSIITAANDFNRSVHDRMPVLPGLHDLDAWLTGKAETELLRAAPNDFLRMWPVSRRVNVFGLEAVEDKAIAAG
jgi:putative SOS response-associated peptidase YedK